MRLVEDLQNRIGSDISKYYWDTATDHDDYNKILTALGEDLSMSDVVYAIQNLHNAGFKIVKI